MRYDAIVIGGGPGGATTALLLARARWRVAVIEKTEFPRRKVCGEFISASSLPLLQELGVEDAFVAAAGPVVQRVGLFARDDVLTATMPERSDWIGRWGRALGREHLDRLLLEAAARAGAQVWQPWRVTEIRAERRRLICTASAKDTSVDLAAPIVIAANGSWERGPSPMPPVSVHRASDLLAFKAHFRDCDLPSDLMPLLVFPGGYGGMVHSDGGRVSLSCCIRRDALLRARERYGERHAATAVLRHIAASCAGVRDALARATLDDVWLSAGPIRPGMRRRYSDGVFYVGNAAGEAHPIVAEGISMALQAAGLLARQLIARQDEAPNTHALRSIAMHYDADWRAGFSARIQAAAVFAHLAMRPAAVGALLPILKQFPRVLTLGARLSGKATEVVAAN
jgi:flavin-dependent dehydrogenase